MDTKPPYLSRRAVLTAAAFGVSLGAVPAAASARIACTGVASLSPRDSGFDAPCPACGQRHAPPVTLPPSPVE
jgi:hypothetical protein